ncbi:MAG: hypothetical protein AAF699_11380 [Pseudomonadota bacterium]
MNQRLMPCLDMDRSYGMDRYYRVHRLKRVSASLYDLLAWEYNSVSAGQPTTASAATPGVPWVRAQVDIDNLE